MPPLTTLMAALIPITFLAVFYAVRPIEPAAGRIRLAVLRSAVIVGSYAIVTVESLSLSGFLTPAGIRGVWCVGSVAALIAAGMRFRRDRRDRKDGGRPGWPRLPRLTYIEWLIAAGLTIIAAMTFTVAVATEPNNWDSQMYHLPKVEQWVAHGSVEPFPVFCFPQVGLGPGSEYLLLHLRLLTGGDALYNMVQWLAGVVCVVVASLVAARLGAQRLGQWVAAVVVATTPMVLLEATSTQTDLVAAAWSVCVALLVFDSAYGRRSVGDTVLLGLAVGLAAVTKATGITTAGLLMIFWIVVRASKVRSTGSAARLAGATLGIAALALIVVGPFLARLTYTYGHPLGPEVVRHHGMQRHDPAAVSLNGARLLHTATMVPNGRINDTTASIVTWYADLLDENILDPDITLADKFPLPMYAGRHEDLAPYPLQIIAIGVGLIYGLTRLRGDRRVFAYTLCCIAIWIGFAASIKWQWYANRLLLPGLVVCVPLVGLAVDALHRRSHHLAERYRARPALGRCVTAGATACLLFGVIAINVLGVRIVALGEPRALWGERSVLKRTEWQNRFTYQGEFAEDYWWATRTVKAAGADRIGMVHVGSAFEYPWWLMLKGHQIVNMDSDVPGHPSPPPNAVDAIICYMPPQPNCGQAIPPTWSVQSRTYVSVALPPGRRAG